MSPGIKFSDQMWIKEDIGFRAGKAIIGALGSIVGTGLGVAQAIALPTYIRKSNWLDNSNFAPNYGSILNRDYELGLSDDPRKDDALGFTLVGSTMAFSALARWGTTATGLIDLMDGDISRAGWIAVPWAASTLYEGGRAIHQHIYRKGVRDARAGKA